MAEEIGLKVVLEADTSKLNASLAGIGGGGGSGGGAMKAGLVGGLAGGAAFAALPKLLSVFQKASPALQGTFKILEQSFVILFRPLGDFLSMILRPLALILLSASVELLKWLRGLKTSEAEHAGFAGDEGALPNLLENAFPNVDEVAKINRDFSVGWFKRILPPEARFVADLTKVFTQIFVDLPLAIITGFGDILAGFFVWGQEIGDELFDAFENLFEGLGLDTLFEGIGSGVEQLLSGDFDGVIQGLTQFFEDIDTAIKNLIGFSPGKELEKIVKGVTELADKVYNWVDSNIIQRVSSIFEQVASIPRMLANAFIDLANFVIDGINNIIASIRDMSFGGFGNVVSPFKGILSGINLERIPRLATGGDITRSGLAYLHEGERVVPAGVNRSTNLGGVTVNVQGGNYNERELAERIATEIMNKISSRTRV